MKVWIIRSYSFQDNETYYEGYENKQAAIAGLLAMFIREDKEMIQEELESIVNGKVYADGYDTIEFQEIQVKKNL